MDQLTSLLPTGDIHLDNDILDRIDKLVLPGQDLNIIDHGWKPPWTEDASQRRRH
jgi:hypothetical protein